MGGEGPYVSFDGDVRQGRASARPPHPLEDKQLEEAYARAHVFMLERVRQLVELGWEQHETDNSLLASLSYTRVLTTYWGERSNSRWKKMFERSALFEARRRRWGSSAPDRYADAYLYVDVEAPLRDIFNLLQCLIPDMLVIIRVDDLDDVGEEETTQRLPSSKWVEDYANELRPIFGEERFMDVAEASRKWETLSRMVSSYQDDYSYGEATPDFTACDKECGYCGRCEY